MNPINRLDPGQVLLAWRQHSGLTQQELVDALAAQDRRAGGKPKVSGKGTVANWEAGLRSPKLHVVRKIAVALCRDAEEQEALVGLWQAAGSVSALPPRLYWEHNYDAKGGRPAWLWLRCVADDQSLMASVGWGPFGADLEVPTTSAGLLVHSPTSVPNPALQVRFSDHAWADFGNGAVPKGVIERIGMKSASGIVVASGRYANPPKLRTEEVARVNADLDAMKLATSKFRILWSRVKPHLGFMRPNTTIHPLEDAPIVQTNWAGTLRVNGRDELETQILQPLEGVKEIRRVSRNLSTKAAAMGANSIAGMSSEPHITDNQIETLERKGSIPQEVRWFIARLDHVYKLDGYLGIERTYNSSGAPLDRQGRYKVAFPSFWVGPIWLQFHAAPGQDRRTKGTAADLFWGDWRRLQRIRHGVILMTRKWLPQSEPNLLVRVPSGWTFVAGTGLPPGATDIQQHWYPANFSAAARLILEGIRMLRKMDQL
ncbi:helix-turn-helix transcriptional regulator [Micromonospora sp. WMMD1082]|uniref:helix-turn-helix domain-containing protein n=1 Tax=Micromonospora sp. WMMD1082 TaxID=3016104 RepID=UPI00241790EA|nr:helix-turn-helix transcriptional regulator [Micromonospora sp. WMMD1082]MDG4794990.1 helix-turn-helix transcriptional regulator [Micromonospora sp. WMMD1082]